jgi:DNA-binding NarL/FixJ family response regulator
MTKVMIRVVLIDDHPVVRSGIRHLLEKTPDIVVVGETGEGSEAMRLIDELAPDVVLLDMEMPGQTGVEIARRLQAIGSRARILAISAYDDEHYIIALLASGAAGYLTKDEALEKIGEAVRGVARGEEGWLSRRAAARVAAWTRKGSPRKDDLTEREVEILRLLARGWTNGAVADALEVSERTVRFHVTNICSKLGVETRGEAVAWAMRYRLVDTAGD